MLKTGLNLTIDLKKTLFKFTVRTLPMGSICVKYELDRIQGKNIVFEPAGSFK